MSKFTRHHGATILKGVPGACQELPAPSSPPLVFFSSRRSFLASFFSSLRAVFCAALSFLATCRGGVRAWSAIREVAAVGRHKGEGEAEGCRAGLAASAALASTAANCVGFCARTEVACRMFGRMARGRCRPGSRPARCAPLKGRLAAARCWRLRGSARTSSGWERCLAFFFLSRPEPMVRLSGWAVRRGARRARSRASSAKHAKPPHSWNSSSSSSSSTSHELSPEQQH